MKCELTALRESLMEIQVQLHNHNYGTAKDWLFEAQKISTDLIVAVKKLAEVAEVEI